MKDLNEINKKYWKKVPAGETASPKIVPSDDELGHVPAEGDVLDVGCGDGQMSEQLSQKGFSVCAIDINKNAIDACKQHNSKVNYSTQDITKKTTFDDNAFDLLCFGFTLTNIHPDKWPAVRQEVDRLISFGGLVWFAEPLVSSDYQKRYKLSKKLLGGGHAIFVFKNPKTASNISTTDQLQTAIDRDEILRISRHYTKAELMSLFPKFDAVHERKIEISSPSGFKIKTLVALLQKKRR